MAFNLRIRKQGGGDDLVLILDVGSAVFVLGANGTGKSSLMHEFFRQDSASAKRITAHRRTWLESNAPTLSAGQLLNWKNNSRGFDLSPNARWSEDAGGNRMSALLSDLIDAQSARAQTVADAVDRGDLERAKVIAENDPGPIANINQLLRASNLPIEISIQNGQQLFASKKGSPAYSIAQLSDGERNAVLMGAAVLSAKPGTLFLIDEPERHLHRSIISAFLTSLFAKRDDCAFVVSTHEVELPLDHPGSTTLLLRGCVNESENFFWDANLLDPASEIDPILKKEILGSRRKILFVEGEAGSLDRSLYNILFPNASVIPKGGITKVIHSVSGVRGTQNLHWLEAFGIVDGDGRSSAEIEQLRKDGVYALPVYSVESIYYHPQVQELVAKEHCTVTGETPAVLIQNAKEAALAKVSSAKLKLAQARAERLLREQGLTDLPDKNDVLTGKPKTVLYDIPTKVSEAIIHLDNLICTKELELIIQRYPIGKKGALTAIANNLGFKDETQYEGTVRHLLTEDTDLLDAMRALFGPLIQDLGLL